MTLPPVLFVTGTDTGVGKTVVTAALTACLHRDRSVAVFKPAQTGVGPGEAGDADEVRRLSGVTAVLEGVRLRDPLAPAVAARRQRAPVPTVAEHAETLRRLAACHDTVLVEGAGGLLVGLDAQGGGLTELAAALALPAAFLVVVRAGLGTLNHTGLTLEALARRGLPLLGVAVGSAPAKPGLAERTNLAGLEELAGGPLIGQVPAGAGRLPGREFRAAAPRWFRAPIGDS